MQFESLKDCRQFFNLMMLEHDVKGIAEYSWLELWTVQITDGRMFEHEWETVKVLTGTHGDIFIFTPSALTKDPVGFYTLHEDIGVTDGGCSELPDEVVHMLNKAVRHDYIPVGLLTAIGDFRRDPEEADTAANFLMTYGAEVDAALKMINLLHP